MDDTTLVQSSPVKEKCQTHNTPSSSKLLPKALNKRGQISKVAKFDKTDFKTNSSLISDKLVCNELTKELRKCQREASELEQAIKILEKASDDEKTETLIEKWRNICQCGMSFLMNSTLIKIDKMGGYEELRRKEIDGEKRKIEYQLDDGMEAEIDQILESEEFQRLSKDDQAVYKEQLDDKLAEAQVWKEKEFERLDQELLKAANESMTMKELSKRLKVEFEMVFPSN